MSFRGHRDAQVFQGDALRATDSMLLRRDHQDQQGGRDAQTKFGRGHQAVERSRLQEMILGQKFNRVSEDAPSSSPRMRNSGIVRLMFDQRRGFGTVLVRGQL